MTTAILFMTEGLPFGPPFGETRAPPLERLEWQQLERLIESLLMHEPDVLTASKYGTPGQIQFGIDIKAELRSGGCYVASCKSYSEIKRGQLAQWSTAFLEHWDSHWKGRRVRRFILITTADVSSRQVHDDAEVESSRFARLGVSYELWGQPQLLEKMRLQHGIVAQFIGVGWVEVVCGRSQREALLPEGASVGIEGVGVGQIIELRTLLSGEAEQRVIRGQEDLRAGHLDAVDRAIKDLRAEPLWSQLEGVAQARVLRFAASVALQRNDLETATTLADQADDIAPEAEPRLAAQIAFQRDGGELALSVLGTPSTHIGRQIQIAFLLSMGDIEGAEAALLLSERDRVDSETTRLRIWALLMRNRREEALALVVKLESEAGQWLATIRTAAVVRYAVALSPALEPEWFLNASPVDLDLVRDDDEGRTHLQHAVESLKSLSDRTSDADDRRWLLAALANQRESREEAQSLARNLIVASPSDPITIAWILARSFDVDLAPSREILAQKYLQGEVDQVEVRVYALMLIAANGPEATCAILSAHADAQSGDARIETDTWMARLSAEIGGGETGPAPEIDDLVGAIRRARTSGKWDVVKGKFAELAGGAKPEPATLAVAQLLAAERQWDILAPYQDAILSFATSEAVRVVAHIIFNTGSGDHLTEFLKRYQSAFRGGEVPPDIQRLVVESRRRVGDLVSALREARALSARSGAPADRHLEAHVRARSGDTMGAASIVRDLLQSGDLQPDIALRWGEMFRVNDLCLAQDLWRYAVAADPGRRYADAAFVQAHSLGLEEEAAPLFADVARVAKEGSSVVRMLSIADVPKLLVELGSNFERRATQYLAGRVPAQLLAESRNIGLDKLLLSDGQQGPGPLRIRLLRNGARPRHLDVGIPWSQWRLHMDLGALLIAAESNLMDTIERHPHPITISSAVPDALLHMQHLAAPVQPSRLSLLRDLVSLVGNKLHERHQDIRDKVVGVIDAEVPGEIDLTPTELIYCAFREGVIDEAEYQDSLAVVGREKALLENYETMARPINAGSRLWLTGIAAEQLARTGLLPLLCLTYEVGIDPKAVSIRRDYILGEDLKAGRVKWLGTLLQRLRRGIERGQFVFARRPPNQQGDVGNIALEPSAVAGLMDMLVVEETAGAVTWFEDRNLTGYPANRNHVIVEFVDVLEALAAEGILAKREAEKLLHSFLGAGGGFVQLDADDIVPALRRAPIVHGTLHETPALIAIRRNRAAMWLLDEHLKVEAGADPDDTRPNEVRLLVTEMRLPQACLTAIWRDVTQSVEECILRSEWVWRALRVERALRTIPDAGEENTAIRFATLCFSSAVESLSDPTELPVGFRRERVQAFGDWFLDAILAPRLVGDRDIAARIAEVLEQLYLPLLERHRPGDLDVWRSVIKVRVAALPSPIIEALGSRRRFCFLMGLGPTELIGVRHVNFDAVHFWRSVKSARLYGRAKLRTIDGKHCRMRRTRGGVEIKGAVRAQIDDPAVRIFDRNVVVIEELERVVSALELSPDDRGDIMKNVSSGSAAEKIGAAAAEGRRRSAKAVYAAMDDAFQRLPRVPLQAVRPPPVRSLLHFLRLQPGDGDFQSRLTQAVERLVHDVGAAEAVRRLGGLPVGRLLELARIEITPELQTELGYEVTPVPVFRWGEAALSRATTCSEQAAIVKEVFGRIEQTVKALVIILKWSVHAFWCDVDFRSLDSSDQLALVWVHSDRVLGVFLKHKVDPARICECFSEWPLREPISDILEYSRFIESDAASPATVTAEVLVFHAMAALFEEGCLSVEMTGDFREKIESLISFREGGHIVPVPALTIRNLDGPNVLGSFLRCAPERLWDLAGDLRRAREVVIRHAIDSVEENQGSALTWALLAEHARTGLSHTETQRVYPLLTGLDVGKIGVGTRDELPLPRMVVRTMCSILRPEHRGRILEVVRAVARDASLRGYSAEANWNDNQRGTLDPVCEVLEICAVYASIESACKFERLEGAILIIAEEWPESIPTLREFVENLIRLNGVVRAAPLWRLHLYFNACP